MTRNRNALAAIVCLALTALGIAACGSSSDSGGGFAAEANQACKEAAKRKTAIFISPVGDESSRKQAESAEKQYLASGEELVGEMKGLEAPEESRAAFTAYLRAEEKALETQRELVKAVEANDRDRFGEISEEEHAEGKRVIRLASRVPELDVCAQKMSPAAIREVEKTIEDNETTADPAQCTEYIEPNRVKAAWKNIQGCRKFQSSESRNEIPHSVDVKVVEGVDGVRATAYVTFHGGSTDGQTAEFGMAYDEGKWKLAFAGPKEG